MYFYQPWKRILLWESRCKVTHYLRINTKGGRWGLKLINSNYRACIYDTQFIPIFIWFTFSTRERILKPIYYCKTHTSVLYKNRQNLLKLEHVWNISINSASFMFDDIFFIILLWQRWLKKICTNHLNLGSCLSLLWARLSSLCRIRDGPMHKL